MIIVENLSQQVGDFYIQYEDLKKRYFAHICASSNPCFLLLVALLASPLERRCSRSLDSTKPTRFCLCYIYIYIGIKLWDNSQLHIIQSIKTPRQKVDNIAICFTGIVYGSHTHHYVTTLDFEARILGMSRKPKLYSQRIFVVDLNMYCYIYIISWKKTCIVIFLYLTI